MWRRNIHPAVMLMSHAGEIWQVLRWSDWRPLACWNYGCGSINTSPRWADMTLRKSMTQNKECGTIKLTKAIIHNRPVTVPVLLLDADDTGSAVDITWLSLNRTDSHLPPWYCGWNQEWQRFLSGNVCPANFQISQPFCASLKAQAAASRATGVSVEWSQRVTAALATGLTNKQGTGGGTDVTPEILPDVYTINMSRSTNTRIHYRYDFDPPFAFRIHQTDDQHDSKLHSEIPKNKYSYDSVGWKWSASTHQCEMAMEVVRGLYVNEHCYR